MTKEFECKTCKDLIEKYYGTAEITVLSDGKSYYQFRCRNCGTLYLEEVGEPIKI